MDPQQQDALLEELCRIRKEMRITRIANLCTAGLVLAVLILLLGGPGGLFGTLLAAGVVAVGVILWRDQRTGKPASPGAVVPPPRNSEVP